MKQGLVAQTGDFDFLVEQVNRNKRNVCLDLKHPDSRPRARAARRAGPTSSSRTSCRRCGASSASSRPISGPINPRLIYARGHGQGTKGPDAEAGGYDAVSFWSRAGLGHMLSGPARRGDAAARAGRHARPACSSPAASRRRSSRASATGAGAPWTWRCSRAASGRSRPIWWRRRCSGADPPKPGAGARASARHGARRASISTSDGRVLQLNMLATDKYWKPACEALEAPDLAADPALASGRGPRAAPARDPRALRAHDRGEAARALVGAAARGRLHLLLVRDADRGAERSAGGRERLPAAPSDAPDGAARREPGAVRRDADRDPPRRARQGRAHRRGARGARPRARPSARALARRARSREETARRSRRPSCSRSPSAAARRSRGRRRRACPFAGTHGARAGSICAASCTSTRAASHDSPGTIEEVVAAARSAGVAWVAHHRAHAAGPARAARRDRRRHRDPGLRAEHGGRLAARARRGGAAAPATKDPAALVRHVHAAGGVAFVAPLRALAPRRARGVPSARRPTASSS